MTIGINLPVKRPTPEEWEKMKDGFTQAHGCKNCKKRAWIKIFKRDNEFFCRCPKCLVEGRWYFKK